MRGRTRARGWSTAVALAAVATTVLAACAQVRGDGGGEDRRAGTGAPDGATGVLSTLEWGELDGMVSVRVRNDGDRTLRRATAVVTATDQHGVSVASSAAQAVRSDCCTVLDLPPGATYGFYFDTTVDATAIADVEVRYRDVAWGAARDPASAATATATAADLVRSREGTVVLADVTPTGAALDGATVQAWLADPDGDLLAVVSGRWRCFPAGSARRIEMQLFHPVPAGTTVTGVQVLPLGAPNSVDDYVDALEPACADGS